MKVVVILKIEHENATLKLAKWMVHKIFDGVFGVEVISVEEIRASAKEDNDKYNEEWLKQEPDWSGLDG